MDEKETTTIQEANNINVLENLLWEYRYLAVKFVKLKSALKNEALLSTININQVELMQSEHPVITVDQTFVTVHETVNFQILYIVCEAFYHTAHRRVQCLTVSAACQ